MRQFLVAGIFFSILTCTAFAADSVYPELPVDSVRSDSTAMAATLARMQHLSAAAIDSTKKDSTILFSLDSAQITEPAVRRVLSGTSTPVSVVPRCAVDSVTIFVRHSRSRTDTLACIHTPPYTTIWDYSSLPDQDQIHLQFGYKLHTSSGKTIISKALPHNWTIDRSKRKRRRTYHCRQTLTPDTIIIDGKTDEWRRMRRGRLGNGGSFAFTWTNAALYFAAWINDDSITAADFIEINLDPYFAATSLSDSRHRCIRFGPASRSYCLVAHPVKDSSIFQQCDSIAALLCEGMSWRIVRSSTGYTLEAMLPFYALSDLDFPSLKSGLDVACQTRTSSSGEGFHSWAGCSEFNRYNPSEWGVLVLHQAMLPLKLTIFISAAILGIFCLVIVIRIVYHFILSQQIETIEQRGMSDELRRLQEYVDSMISTPGITPQTASETLAMPQSDITGILDRELDCTFTQFVDSRRIMQAKNDLWNFSLSLETVAANAGYLSLDAMNASFQQHLHTDPQHYRNQAIEMASEEPDDSEPHAAAATLHSPSDMPS